MKAKIKIWEKTPKFRFVSNRVREVLYTTFRNGSGIEKEFIGDNPPDKIYEKHLVNELSSEPAIRYYDGEKEVRLR